MKTTAQRWMSYDTLMVYLDVKSKKTIQNKVSAGLFPKPKRIGGLVRFDRYEIDRMAK